MIVPSACPTREVVNRHRQAASAPTREADIRYQDRNGRRRSAADVHAIVVGGRGEAGEAGHVAGLDATAGDSTRSSAFDRALVGVVAVYGAVGANAHATLLNVVARIAAVGSTRSAARVGIVTVEAAAVAAIVATVLGVVASCGAVIAAYRSTGKLGVMALEVARPLVAPQKTFWTVATRTRLIGAAGRPGRGRTVEYA